MRVHVSAYMRECATVYAYVLCVVCVRTHIPVANLGGLEGLHCHPRTYKRMDVLL